VVREEYHDLVKKIDVAMEKIVSEIVSNLLLHNNYKTCPQEIKRMKTKVVEFIQTKYREALRT
jgi:hypothetical protein